MDPITTLVAMLGAPVATATGSAGIGAAAGTAALGYGGYKGAQAIKRGLSPKAPGMEDPKVAPVPDDQASRRAKERQSQRRYAAAGRQGTILSESSGLG